MLQPTADQATAVPATPTRLARFRYAFDNSLAAGPIALIGWLAVVSAILVLVGGLLVVLFGVAPEGGGALGGAEAAWQSLMHTLDIGAVAGDSGRGYRAVMFVVSIGGLFVVSALIGVLTTGMEGRLDELRKGRSVVAETGHTLILGWSQKIFTVLTELAVANESCTRPCVVILADRDKVEMEDEIRAQVSQKMGKTRVVCRSGSPMSTTDLAIANPAGARSIIVLAHDDEHPDRDVLKSLLAIVNSPDRPAGANHVVATMREQQHLDVARMIAPDDARLIHVGDLIAHITAQTCRQSGLSAVYTELLDFAGDEIYLHSEPALVGRTFGEALFAFEQSALMGLAHRDGTVELNPPMDTVLVTGDVLVLVAEDDSAVKLAPAPITAAQPELITEGAGVQPTAERTLVLGWSARGPEILKELDKYVADGSVVDVVDEQGDGEIFTEVAEALEHTTLYYTQAQASERATLESLELGTYDHVIVLTDETEDRDAADTATLITLLHLRDMAARDGNHHSTVTEILDSRNRELASARSADDFIVGDELVSLLLAQISENRTLADVFENLFEAEGSEIYLRPAADCVAIGTPVTFATVVESAKRRGETAIGFRDVARATDAAAGYGVKLNPPKTVARVYGPDDRVVVLAVD